MPARAGSLALPDGPGGFQPPDEWPDVVLATVASMGFTLGRGLRASFVRLGRGLQDQAGVPPLGPAPGPPPLPAPRRDAAPPLPVLPAPVGAPLARLPAFNSTRETMQGTMSRWRETAARSLLSDGVEVQAQALHQRIVQLATEEDSLERIPAKPLPRLHQAHRQWMTRQLKDLKLLLAQEAGLVATSAAQSLPPPAAAPAAQPTLRVRRDRAARASRSTPAGSPPADAASHGALAAATVLSAGIRVGAGPPILARVHPEGVQQERGTVRQRELSPNLPRDEDPLQRGRQRRRALSFRALPVITIAIDTCSHPTRSRLFRC